MSFSQRSHILPLRAEVNERSSHYVTTGASATFRKLQQRSPRGAALIESPGDTSRLSQLIANVPDFVYQPGLPPDKVIDHRPPILGNGTTATRTSDFKGASGSTALENVYASGAANSAAKEHLFCSHAGINNCGSANSRASKCPQFNTALSTSRLNISALPSGSEDSSSGALSNGRGTVMTDTPSNEAYLSAPASNRLPIANSLMLISPSPFQSDEISQQIRCPARLSNTSPGFATSSVTLYPTVFASPPPSPPAAILSSSLPPRSASPLPQLAHELLHSPSKPHLSTLPLHTLSPSISNFSSAQSLPSVQGVRSPQSTSPSPPDPTFLLRQGKTGVRHLCQKDESQGPQQLEAQDAYMGPPEDSEVAHPPLSRSISVKRDYEIGDISGDSQSALSLGSTLRLLPSDIPPTPVADQAITSQREVQISSVTSEGVIYQEATDSKCASQLIGCRSQSLSLDTSCYIPGLNCQQLIGSLPPKDKTLAGLHPPLQFQGGGDIDDCAMGMNEGASPPLSNQALTQGSNVSYHIGRLRSSGVVQSSSQNEVGDLSRRKRPRLASTTCEASLADGSITATCKPTDVRRGGHALFEVSADSSGGAIARGMPVDEGEKLRCAQKCSNLGLASVPASPMHQSATAMTGDNLSGTREQLAMGTPHANVSDNFSLKTSVLQQTVDALRKDNSSFALNGDPCHPPNDFQESMSEGNSEREGSAATSLVNTAGSTLAAEGSTFGDLKREDGEQDKKMRASLCPVVDKQALMKCLISRMNDHRNLLKERLARTMRMEQAHRTYVANCHAQATIPFQSLGDAIARLLPFHVYCSSPESLKEDEESEPSPRSCVRPPERDTPSRVPLVAKKRAIKTMCKLAAMGEVSVDVKHRTSDVSGLAWDAAEVGALQQSVATAEEEICQFNKARASLNQRTASIFAMLSPELRSILSASATPRLSSCVNTTPSTLQGTVNPSCRQNQTGGAVPGRIAAGESVSATSNFTPHHASLRLAPLAPPQAGTGVGVTSPAVTQLHLTGDGGAQFRRQHTPLTTGATGASSDSDGDRLKQLQLHQLKIQFQQQLQEVAQQQQQLRCKQALLLQRIQSAQQQGLEYGQATSFQIQQQLLVQQQQHLLSQQSIIQQRLQTVQREASLCSRPPTLHFAQQSQLPNSNSRQQQLLQEQQHLQRQQQQQLPMHPLPQQRLPHEQAAPQERQQISQNPEHQPSQQEQGVQQQRQLLQQRQLQQQQLQELRRRQELRHQQQLQWQQSLGQQQDLQSRQQQIQQRVSDLQAQETLQQPRQQGVQQQQPLQQQQQQVLQQQQQQQQQQQPLQQHQPLPQRQALGHEAHQQSALQHGRQYQLFQQQVRQQQEQHGTQRSAELPLQQRTQQHAQLQVQQLQQAQQVQHVQQRLQQQVQRQDLVQQVDRESGQQQVQLQLQQQQQQQRQQQEQQQLRLQQVQQQHLLQQQLKQQVLQRQLQQQTHAQASAQQQCSESQQIQIKHPHARELAPHNTIQPSPQVQSQMVRPTATGQLLFSRHPDPPVQPHSQQERSGLQQEGIRLEQQQMQQKYQLTSQQQGALDSSTGRREEGHIMSVSTDNEQLTSNNNGHIAIAGRGDQRGHQHIHEYRLQQLQPPGVPQQSLPRHQRSPEHVDQPSSELPSGFPTQQVQDGRFSMRYHGLDKSSEARQMKGSSLVDEKSPLEIVSPTTTRFLYPGANHNEAPILYSSNLDAADRRYLVSQQQQGLGDASSPGQPKNDAILYGSGVAD